MKNNYLLLSLPRSGSTFLSKKIIKNNPHIIQNHKKEFFNLNNKKYSHIFKLCFGSAKNYKPIATHPINHELHKHIYDNSFIKENINFTKEVLSTFKINFFKKYFTIFTLLRHRKLTFPGVSKRKNSTRLYLAIYNSLLHNNTTLHDTSRALEFSKTNSSNVYEKCCSAHIIMSYITLRECQKYSIPIINYEKFVTISEQEKLHNYLKDKLPNELLNKILIKDIIKNINVNIPKKEELYKKINTEIFCKKLLKKLDLNLLNNENKKLLY